jgi:3-(3-hydroxy-phenyl)propionate hydroxylase
MLFPQPSIVEGVSSRLLDTFTGPEWRLILDGRRVGVGEGERLAGGIDGIVVRAVAPEGYDDADPASLREKDGVLSAWFDRHGAIGAIVRPDHYVFGAAQNVEALRQQLAELSDHLA